LLIAFSDTFMDFSFCSEAGATARAGAPTLPAPSFPPPFTKYLLGGAFDLIFSSSGFAFFTYDNWLMCKDLNLLRFLSS
jgi:hypothetical protein